MLVSLISGCQGSGKTTTADAVAESLVSKGFHVKRLRFAQPLYEMHDACQAVLKKYGIVRPAIDADLLQLIGTEYGRNVIGENVWVNCIQNAIKDYEDHLQTHDEVIYLLDDLRFPNEFDAFPDGYKSRLECDRDIRKSRRGDKWRKNETHPSEVALNEYVAQGKFDIVLDTGVLPVEAVVSEIATQVQIRAQTKINKQAIHNALGEDDDNSTVSE